MKIIQIIGSLTYGDGMGNCVLYISQMLDELNYANDIITFYLDERIQQENIYLADIHEPITANEDDIIMYHFGAGVPFNYIVESLPYKKILVYQNVTTPDFFRGVDDATLKSCLWGLYDASKTAGRYLKSIVMSEFSKGNLLEMGWKAEDISVMPLIKTNDKAIKWNQEIIDRYSDGCVNILFTGRIVPNKKIEDVIRIFSCYQKKFTNKCRLILIGSIQFPNYYEALKKYIEDLKAENVFFTGHISNEDLEAYYAVSDIFLCMSEHEGFCIPLVEAMKRKLPVVAYSAAAVPDTLGGAGVLVDTKEEEEVSRIMDRLVSDCGYRESIIDSQNKRLTALGLENHKAELINIIEEVSRQDNAVCTQPAHDMNGSSAAHNVSYYPGKGDLRISYPERGCLKDIGYMYQNRDKIIIYGFGRIGKGLLTGFRIKGSEFVKKIIICDNTYEGNNYDGIPVVKHQECVLKYPKALYIVTVQREFVSIIADLVSDGIEKKNIKFYNASADKVV